MRMARDEHVIGVRLSGDMLADLDRYLGEQAAAHPHRTISRSDVVRELIARGLTHASRARKKIESA